MKKSVLLVLSFIFVISVCGCEKTPENNNDTVIDGETKLVAVITEVGDNYFLVKPVEGSQELKSSDIIDVPMKNIVTEGAISKGDTIEIVYGGGLQEVYPARITEVYSITLVKKANDPKNEENLDFGITLTAENVTPTGMTLCISQKGGNDVGEIQFGSPYHLEVLSDGIWEKVPYKDEGNIVWTLELYMVLPGGTHTSQLNWEYLYGTLEKGKYRVVKKIENFKGPGDSESKEFSCEFKID